MEDSVAQVNREELAWAAGFFDGEGCTTSNKGRSRFNRRYPKIHITQAVVGDENVPEVLLRFQRIFSSFGINAKINGPQLKGNHKPLFHLRISSFEHVQQVISMMWPYLGTVKREQAAKVLKESSYYEAPTHCSYGHPLQIHSDGRAKSCRPCGRRRQKEYRERKKEQ